MSEEKKTYKCSKVFKTCKYGKVLSGAQPMCDYILMEGHRRGCDPEECDKYEDKGKGKGKGKKAFRIKMSKNNKGE